MNSLLLHDASEPWDRLREALHQRIGETVAWSFFAESMEFGGYEQGKLTLMLATDIAVDFAKRQHGEMIQGLAKVFYPDMVELCFVAKLADPAVAPPLTLTPRTSVPEIKLEPKFEPLPQTAAGVLDSTYPLDVECHFGNFVIGNANQEAYFAMRRAAEAPGLSSFNPLFLHGGPGLGKSHLLQAVAWHALDHGTARKVVARPADEFKNEFFASLSSRKNSVGFQAKLREADVLLIDDIQFLGATQAIQQELVSLINFMVSQRKQVILVSDRPPSEIPHLSKSLLEKCQSGLMLDVRSPAEELRQGILRKLADRRHAGSQVPEHVIAMLSQMGHGDVRELIGMLTRLIAFADIHREPLTEELVRRLFGEAQGIESSRRLGLDLIVEEVAAEFGLAPEKIVSRSRMHEAALPRKVCLHLARQMTDLSLHTIGLHFNRDYTTVIFNLKAIAKLMNMNADLAHRVACLRAKLSTLRQS